MARSNRQGVRRQTFLRPLNVEKLEDRKLMAVGNVLVYNVGSSVRIEGDQNANNIAMVGLPTGGIRISGVSLYGQSTTINGRSSMDIAPIGDVLVDMGAGNDRVTIQKSVGVPGPSFKGGLAIRMGDGDDKIDATDFAVTKQLSVDLGTGADSSARADEVNLTNARLGNLFVSMTRSTGFNHARIAQSTINGDVRLDGSRGSDQFSLNNTLIGGSLSIMAGNETYSSSSDSASLMSVSVRSKIDIQMGTGKGYVEFFDVTADSADVYFGDYESDTFIVNNSRFKRVNFDGMGGNKDKISGSGNQFGALPNIRFEINKIS